MPLPPSTPPPALPESPPPYVNLEAYRRGTADLPAWVETAKVDAANRRIQKTDANAAAFAVWVEEASKAIMETARIVQERGASNVDEILEEFNVGAIQASKAAADISVSIKSLRNTAKELRKQGDSITDPELKNLAAELYAKAKEVELTSEAYRPQIEAFRSLYGAYEEALSSITAVRHAQLVREAAELSDEVLLRFWDTEW